MNKKTLNDLKVMLSKAKHGNCPVMFYQIVEAAECEKPKVLHTLFSDTAIQNILAHKSRFMLCWEAFDLCRLENVALVLDIPERDLYKITRFIPNTSCNLVTLQFRRNLYNSGLDPVAVHRLTGVTITSVNNYLSCVVDSKACASVLKTVQDKCYYGLDGSIRSVLELAELRLVQLDDDPEMQAILHKEFYEQVKELVNEHTTSA